MNGSIFRIRPTDLFGTSLAFLSLGLVHFIVLVMAHQSEWIAFLREPKDGLANVGERHGLC